MSIYEVQIITGSIQDLRTLGKLDLDLKHRAARQDERNRFVVPGILNDEEIERVRAAGYEVNVIDDLSEVAEMRKRELTDMNRFVSARDISEMAARTAEGYMTADEVEDALKNMSEQYPNLIKLIELPNRTWEDRVSHAVCLGAGENINRTGVLFTGSMHAREWGGADICVSFLLNLINAYENSAPLQYGGKVFSAEQVRAMLEKIHVYVFPDVNPDGKNHSQTVYPMWRKNRNPNTAVDPASPGVDLNRNFDFLWNSEIGTSANPASNVYKGENPFSEPEIRNVLHLFETYPNIGYYVDIHSYSELILYSWGDDDNQTADPTQNFSNPAFDEKRGILEDQKYREFISPLDEIIGVGLAHRMNDALAAVHGGRGYTVQESSGLYPTTATSSDYAFSRNLADNNKNKIQGWTIEFGKEFIPPFSEMRKIIKEIDAAMSELCWSVAVRELII